MCNEFKASLVWHIEPRIKMNMKEKKTKTDMHEITKKQLQSIELFEWVKMEQNCGEEDMQKR